MRYHLPNIRQNGEHKLELWQKITCIQHLCMSLHIYIYIYIYIYITLSPKFLLCISSISASDYKSIDLCHLTMLCEGSSSAANVRVLVSSCYSTISYNASSTTGLSDFVLSSRLMSPSLKHPNKFYTTRFLTVSEVSISFLLVRPWRSDFFPQVA